MRTRTTGPRQRTAARRPPCGSANSRRRATRVTARGRSAPRPRCAVRRNPRTFALTCRQLAAANVTTRGGKRGDSRAGWVRAGGGGRRGCRRPDRREGDLAPRVSVRPRAPPPIVGRVAPDADTFADTSAPADSQREQRLRKADQARGSGYPYRYPTDATAAGIRAAHAGLAPDQVTEHEVHIAGRLELIRRQGGLTFATLRDRTGAIQLFVDTARRRRRRCTATFDELDRGDWVGVAGHGDDHPARRAVGRASSEFALLAQGAAAAARQAPRAHRRRDPLPAALRRPRWSTSAPARSSGSGTPRSRAIRDAPRRTAGFTEVEGPVLQTIQGGATARPVRHPPQRPRHRPLPAHRAGAAPQAADRRRAGAGVRDRPGVPQRGHRHPAQPRVHDAGGLPGLRRLPRHDGPDRGPGRRRPRGPRSATRPTVHYGGQAIDLAARPWPRARFADMIAETTGATMHPAMPVARGPRGARPARHSPTRASWGAGRLMKEVYDEKVQHDVVGPVFCIDYPREVSPLARVHRDDPAYVERFELIVAGLRAVQRLQRAERPGRAARARSRPRRGPRRAATPRPATSTTTTSARSSTGMPPHRRARASGSTGW